MTTVLCPGSFDPITVGHIDIITRARDLFGNVLVGVGRNNQKSYLFGDQRIALVREALEGMEGVEVSSIEGLLVNFCREQGITAVIKGLRFGADFDFELQMAHMNRGLTGLETVLLPAAAEHVTLSSTILREVMKLGGDVSRYVPSCVAREINVRRSQPSF